MILMEKVNFTIEEREAANAYIRAQLKRTSEDNYIREEERKKFDAEKLESAKSMLSDGFPPSVISKHLKLSIEEIDKLV